jgi:hypothetical protein
MADEAKQLYANYKFELTLHTEQATEAGNSTYTKAMSKGRDQKTAERLARKRFLNRLCVSLDELEAKYWAKRALLEEYASRPEPIMD